MSFPAYNYLATMMVKKSTAEKTVWPMLIAIFLATTACTSTTDTATMPPTAYAPSQDSQPTATSTNNLIYFFPQQEAVEGERVVMTAMVFGTLVVVEDCIRVNDSESGTSYLLVWPPDFKLNVEDNAIQILNGDSTVVARVGDKVRIGGGEVNSLAFLNESLQKNLPPSCVAPYWIVGDEVNMLETSE